MKVVNSNNIEQIDLSNIDTNNPEEVYNVCLRVIKLQEECMLLQEQRIKYLKDRLSYYEETKETGIRTLSVIKD